MHLSYDTVLLVIHFSGIFAVTPKFELLAQIGIRQTQVLKFSKTFYLRQGCMSLVLSVYEILIYYCNCSLSNRVKLLGTL